MACHIAARSLVGEKDYSPGGEDPSAKGFGGKALAARPWDDRSEAVRGLAARVSVGLGPICAEYRKEGIVHRLARGFAIYHGTGHCSAEEAGVVPADPRFEHRIPPDSRHMLLCMYVCGNKHHVQYCAKAWLIHAVQRSWRPQGEGGQALG